jgi:hypothetical protein
MSPQAEALVSEKDVITTKEELERWQKERARQRQGGGEPTHPPTLDPSQSRRGSWQGDVNLLVAFLKGLKKLMELLINQRVPDEPAERFKGGFSGCRGEHKLGYL